MHIMLDLETWGLTPGSDIRSIGAVTFNPITGNIGKRDERGQFYVATDNPLIPLDAPSKYSRTKRQYPLTRNPETVKWWSEQSADAQAAFANPVDLYEACFSLSLWLAGIIDDAPEQDLRLWCKGPHFDISILAAVYRAVDLDIVWHYHSPRDTRTIVDISGITKDEEKAMFTGTPHHALDDAISQAAVVCEAYKRLGLNNGTA